uniref:glycosyltransferase n=1 Tax=Cyanobium sp. TaxID=2164130 RepID=UPI0040478D9F
MSGAYCVLMPLAPWEPAWVVAASLASLEQQSLLPVALVISCDGPPAESLRGVLDRCRLPLIVVQGPGGEGAGPVLQRGLQACPTDLVVRADADDLNLPNRCERLLKVMEQRPELSALGSWIGEFVQSQAEAPLQQLGERRVPSGAEAIQRFSRWRNPLNHPSTILRRPQITAAGGYRSMASFEDYDLWLRLLAQGYRLDNLAETLVLARVNPAHRQRRRGRSYLAAELRFVTICLREQLLAPWVTALWLLLRCPARLLPQGLLAALMQHQLRQPPAMGPT